MLREKGCNEKFSVTVKIPKEVVDRWDEPTKGPFKNKFRFCWRLFGLLARRERRAYPQRSVRSEQRSQQAKEPQPGGAGRLRAICFVARRSQPHCGGWSLLAPRIWPDGAPAKRGSYF